jgi:hypothetical protein
MSDPETIQNVKQANEEFERKYCKATGEEHPDGHKLMHDILAKRLQTIGGKQYFDSGDHYNREQKNLKIPIINHELAYTVGEKSPPNPRLSPKGRRLSSSSGSSLADSTGIGSICEENTTNIHNNTITPPHGNHSQSNLMIRSQLSKDKDITGSPCIQTFKSISHDKDHNTHYHHGPPHIISSGLSSGISSHTGSIHGGHSPGSNHHGNGGHHSPLNFHGWHHSSHAYGGTHAHSYQQHSYGHGSQSSTSSHFSGSPLNHHLGPNHMSPLHVNTEFSKPVRRLSSTSSCGEPSPLANEGMIQVAFKRPPIPGLDCEAYHGDAIQVSLHSPHSPCTLSTRGRSPSSTHFCLSDNNSCRNSPINTDVNASREEECSKDAMEIKVPTQNNRVKSGDDDELGLNRTNTLTKDQEDCANNCDGDCMDENA